MQWHAVGAVVRHTAVVIAISAGMLAGFPTAADVGAQSRGHSIYMTAVEFRGSTSTDKLAPPSIDPSKLSQGYTYKAPGQADPLVPQRWEVGTFQFSPSYRGREYTKFFQVDKVGDYHLECGIHKPSMTATIMVLTH